MIRNPRSLCSLLILVVSETLNNINTVLILLNAPEGLLFMKGGVFRA